MILAPPIAVFFISIWFKAWWKLNVCVCACHFVIITRYIIGKQKLFKIFSLFKSINLINKTWEISLNLLAFPMHWISCHIVRSDALHNMLLALIKIHAWFEHFRKTLKKHNANVNLESERNLKNWIRLPDLSKYLFIERSLITLTTDINRYVHFCS